MKQYKLILSFEVTLSIKACKTGVKKVDGKLILTLNLFFAPFILCSRTYFKVLDSFWFLCVCVIQYSAFSSLRYLYKIRVVIVMYHRKHVLLDIWYLSCSNPSSENCCFNIYMAISSISFLFWHHSEDLLKWVS